MLTQLATTAGTDGPATLVQAWHLKSTNYNFGSYSALVFLKDGQFFTGSDTGQTLRFTAPRIGQRAGVQTARFERFSGRDQNKKHLVDLESLVRDPATGKIWAGFEGTNSIERLNRDFTGSVVVRPKAMQQWAANSGPEAMVRLLDGRFVVISEGREKWGDTTHAALLFDDDPILGMEPERFAFKPPAGFKPVEATLLPDGRVLILVRKLRIDIPPRFDVKLLVADPADITADSVWAGKEIASITDPQISDNYEGMAVAASDDGSVSIWLISDDNNAALQRTLLLKLRWVPDELRAKEKAPETVERPSQISD